jgi:hypothetical protein
VSAHRSKPQPGRHRALTFWERTWETIRAYVSYYMGL